MNPSDWNDSTIVWILIVSINYLGGLIGGIGYISDSSHGSLSYKRFAARAGLALLVLGAFPVALWAVFRYGVPTIGRTLLETWRTAFPKKAELPKATAKERDK